MAIGIERSRALELLNKHIKNPNMIKHSLASEAVLATLAEHLGEEPGKWAMAGLLHDLDVEITNADLNVHGLDLTHCHVVARVGGYDNKVANLDFRIQCFE